MNARGVSAFFDWVKERSHLFRGVTFGTMRRDDAYQLHAPGHAHRARRLHGAHPRREVPRPAAQREGRGRRRGLLPVVRGAALGVGLRGLPQGLPRRDHAHPARRAPRPARRHPAEPALLHAPGERHARRGAQRPLRPSASAWRGRSSRSCATGASRTSSRRACTSTSRTTSTRCRSSPRRSRRASSRPRCPDEAAAACAAHAL